MATYYKTTYNISFSFLKETLYLKGTSLSVLFSLTLLFFLSNHKKSDAHNSLSIKILKWWYLYSVSTLSLVHNLTSLVIY